jgi:hypothetical protein
MIESTVKHIPTSEVSIDTLYNIWSKQLIRRLGTPLFKIEDLENGQIRIGRGQEVGYVHYNEKIYYFCFWPDEKEKAEIFLVGSCCKKCNSFNEYLEKHNYICYKCKNN